MQPQFKSRMLCTTSKDVNDIRWKILESAVPHVHQWGWTTEAISLGAQDQGLSPYSHGLFPRGAVELAEHVQDSLHDAWVRDLPALDLKEPEGRGPPPPPQAGALRQLVAPAPGPPGPPRKPTRGDPAAGAHVRRG
eukprot:CAMPEP_0172204300 /NCGR_PEP_ID=MMETSP1050-20130122/31855_1 /TAXON_ID=233186 /ORGANISM="Cryptomonas curvata, Strain CCAP979/52" /LENGTH=135 /DNA_ID=CAMNT_0012882795 /DNA_START=139 /DNA_END=542 /DNA_ORIENTATION=+